MSTCEQQIAGRRRHRLLFDLTLEQQGTPFLGIFQGAISFVLQFFHRSIKTRFSSECTLEGIGVGSKFCVLVVFSFLGSKLAPKFCIPFASFENGDRTMSFAVALGLVIAWVSESLMVFKEFSLLDALIF